MNRIAVTARYLRTLGGNIVIKYTKDNTSYIDLEASQSQIRKIFETVIHGQAPPAWIGLVAAAVLYSFLNNNSSVASLAACGLFLGTLSTPDIRKAKGTSNNNILGAVMGRAVVVRAHNDVFEVWARFGRQGDKKAQMNLRADIAIWAELAKKEEIVSDQKLRQALDMIIASAEKPYQGKLYNCMFWMHILSQENKISKEEQENLLKIYESRFMITEEEVAHEVAELRNAVNWMLSQIHGNSSTIAVTKVLIRQIAAEIEGKLTSKSGPKFTAASTLYKTMQGFKRCIPAELLAGGYIDPKIQKASGVAQMELYVIAVKMMEVLRHRRYLGIRAASAEIKKKIQEDEVSRLELAFNKVSARMDVPLGWERINTITRGFILEHNCQVGFAMWKAMNLWANEDDPTSSELLAAEKFVSWLLVEIDREFVSDELPLGDGAPVILVILGCIDPDQLKDLMHRFNVIGGVSNYGTAIGHVSEEFSNYGAPVVFGVPTEYLKNIKQGDTIAVIPQEAMGGEALINVVIHNPTREEVGSVMARMIGAIARQKLFGAQGLSSKVVLANKSEIDIAMAADDIFEIEGDGRGMGDIKDASYVGLVRSEFSEIMQGETLPSEKDLKQFFARMAGAASRKMVVVRTLDRQADKKIKAGSDLPYDDANTGFNFYRTPEGRKIVLLQLKAIVRAYAEKSNVAALFPMLSTVSDVEYVFELLKEASSVANIKDFCVSLMIENISAVDNIKEMLETAAKLARDYKINIRINIGTNDLTKAVLDVNRDDASAGSKLSGVAPSVSRRIMYIVRVAAAYNVPVCICGSFAKTPDMLVLVVNMARSIPGVNLSVAVPFAMVRQTKYYVNKLANNVEIGAELVAPEELAAKAAALISDMENAINNNGEYLGLIEKVENELLAGWTAKQPRDASAEGKSREEVNSLVGQHGGIDAIIAKYGEIDYMKVMGLYNISENVMSQLPAGVRFIRGPPAIGAANYVVNGVIYIILPENISVNDVRHEINAVINPRLSHEENISKLDSYIAKLSVLEGRKRRVLASILYDRKAIAQGRRLGNDIVELENDLSRAKATLKKVNAAIAGLEVIELSVKEELSRILNISSDEYARFVETNPNTTIAERLEEALRFFENDLKLLVKTGRVTIENIDSIRDQDILKGFLQNISLLNKLNSKDVDLLEELIFKQLQAQVQTDSIYGQIYSRKEVSNEQIYELTDLAGEFRALRDIKQNILSKIAPQARRVFNFRMTPAVAVALVVGIAVIGGALLAPNAYAGQSNDQDTYLQKGVSAPGGNFIGGYATANTNQNLLDAKKAYVDQDYATAATKAQKAVEELKDGKDAAALKQAQAIISKAGEQKDKAAGIKHVKKVVKKIEAKAARKSAAKAKEEVKKPAVEEIKDLVIEFPVDGKGIAASAAPDINRPNNPTVIERAGFEKSAFKSRNFEIDLRKTLDTAGGPLLVEVAKDGWNNPSQVVKEYDNGRMIQVLVRGKPMEDAEGNLVWFFEWKNEKGELNSKRIVHYELEPETGAFKRVSIPLKGRDYTIVVEDTIKNNDPLTGNLIWTGKNYLDNEVVYLEYGLAFYQLELEWAKKHTEYLKTSLGYRSIIGGLAWSGVITQPWIAPVANIAFDVIFTKRDIPSGFLKFKPDAQHPELMYDYLKKEAQKNEAWAMLLVNTVDNICDATGWSKEAALKPVFNNENIVPGSHLQYIIGRSGIGIGPKMPTVLKTLTFGKMFKSAPNLWTRKGWDLDLHGIPLFMPMEIIDSQHYTKALENTYYFGTHDEVLGDGIGTKYPTEAYFMEILKKGDIARIGDHPMDKNRVS
ncbi:MAG: hypothetical protein PHJ00_06465, partial [Candidatus Omnitrophica bacterium]|nr:hypothetical protein [Candidatus Omnitrophota bacterium]